MCYIFGLLSGFGGMDYEDLNILIHRTKLVNGRRVRLFTMRQALDVLTGFADARKAMGIYSAV